MQKEKEIKVSYNKTTGEILGYYPDNITYKNIPKPHITIEEKEYNKIVESGKNYIIKKGKIAEYKKPKKEILQEQKDIKIKELELKRKELQYSNIIFKGTEIKATEKARDNLFKAVSLSNEAQKESIEWLDVNNQKIEITVDEGFTILTELTGRDSKLYLAEATAEGRINKAKTEKELNKITL